MAHAPQITALTLAQLEADPTPVIAELRKAHPMLHWGGVADWQDIRRMGNEAFEARRTEMTGPYGVGQVLRAARFIDKAPRIKGVNRRRGTYGWKHVVERQVEATSPRELSYVGEGSFLVAAWALGLLVWQDRVGTYFVNLSEQAAKQGGHA